MAALRSDRWLSFILARSQESSLEVWSEMVTLHPWTVKYHRGMYSPFLSLSMAYCAGDWRKRVLLVASKSTGGKDGPRASVGSKSMPSRLSTTWSLGPCWSSGSEWTGGWNGWWGGWGGCSSCLELRGLGCSEHRPSRPWSS